ncbi:alpha/beta fold hydrolase [Psychroserpens sp. XS_ASV72]|uniref:alpha/beta fold hydrolase n=1 Tax=Psychroserpens sp. XS_ASV72 TaxID=3241293 RepID=UPI0035155D87
MKHLILMLITLPLFGYSQTGDNAMKHIISEYEFETHYVAIDGVNISYVKEGSGDKTLLFIHGLSSNLDAWSKNIESLKSKYTCIALDLPGFGKSDKPEAKYTPTYFSEVIKRFIDEFHLKNVVLIGHSMGGQAAIKLTSTNPDNIEKLVLVAPAGIERFSEAHGNIIKSMFTPSFVANTTDQQIKNNYALNFYKQPEEVSKMIADRIAIKNASDFEAHCNAISKSIAGMIDDPVSNDLEQISKPTLVLFGKNDMLIPNRYFHPELDVVKVGEMAQKYIKNATLLFVDESGHFLQFEQFEKVNDSIEEFIEKD